jgi:hypothetical protein
MGQLVYRTVQFVKRERETWKRAHKQVMADYEVADGLGEAAKIYAALFEQVRSNTEGNERESFDSVVAACETLDLWYEAASDLLAEIDKSEAAEFPVESAGLIRNCHRSAAMLLEDLHDAKNAIDAVRSNRSIGVEEFLDELRHPIHR